MRTAPRSAWPLTIPATLPSPAVTSIYSTAASSTTRSSEAGRCDDCDIIAARMRQLVDAALLMAATLLLLAAAGIVVPAPTRTLLPWSVGAPELSPLILAAATLLLGASMVVRSPRQRRWARVFATVAAALSLTVVLRIASTERLAFERLHAGLDSTAGLEPGMASPWVSMRTLFSPPAQARLVRE